LHLFTSEEVLYHPYLSKTSNTTQSSGTPFLYKGNRLLSAREYWDWVWYLYWLMYYVLW